MAERAAAGTFSAGAGAGAPPERRYRDSRASELYAGERHSLTVGEAFRLLVKIWRFISAHRRLLLIKCALAIGSLTFFLLVPWPVKIVIDNVIDGRPLTGIPARVLLPITGGDRVLLLTAVALFLAAGTILAGLSGDDPTPLGTDVDSAGLDQAGITANQTNDGWSLWNGLFGLWETYATLELSQRINQDVRTAIYQRFLRSPLGLYGDQKIGDAVFRVMYDSAAVTAVFYRGVLAPIMSSVMFILAMAVVTAQFSNEPLIPILAALTLPAVAIISGLFGRFLRDQAQRMRERGSDVMAAFEERLAQVQLIKAYGTEERETRAVDAASWDSFGASLRFVVIVLVMIAVLAPGVGLFVILGLYHLMKEVIANRITLGDVVLLGGYGRSLGRPMRVIGSTWVELQGPIAGLRRVHSVLDRLDEDQRPAAGAADPGRISRLEFRDVAIAYDGAEPVVSAISFTLRAGELAALAGASGTGKTTLICSIPRFFEPCAGAIYANGIDVRNIQLGLLRSRVGFVFQQEALFSRSIADNIRYGAPDASDEDVREAARGAGAAEFIGKLPQGYATILGRRGARLSVGQKQRIAIARALIRKPEVLILDEPTAPLDPGSEAGLMHTLRELAKDRIVTIVAHRPDTLAKCDRVVFMQDGTLIASGTHDELARTCPAYREYLSVTRAEMPPS